MLFVDTLVLLSSENVESTRAVFIKVLTNALERSQEMRGGGEEQRPKTDELVSRVMSRTSSAL